MELGLLDGSYLDLVFVEEGKELRARASYPVCVELENGVAAGGIRRFASGVRRRGPARWRRGTRAGRGWRARDQSCPRASPTGTALVRLPTETAGRR